MITDLQWANRHAAVRQVAGLMARHEVGTVLVTGAGNGPVGIVNGTDLVRRVIAEDRNPLITQVHEVMTRSVVMLEENRPITEAVDLMTARNVRHLGIGREGRVVGIVAACDVVVKDSIPIASARTAMTRPLATIPLGATCQEAAVRMASAAVGCLLVTGRRVRPRPGQHRSAGADIAGILTERDLVRKLVAADRDPYVTPVCSLMTTRLRTIAIEDPLRFAGELMACERLRHLIITGSPDEIVGILSVRDILRAINGTRPPGASPQ